MSIIVGEAPCNIFGNFHLVVVRSPTSSAKDMVTLQVFECGSRGIWGKLLPFAPELSPPMWNLGQIFLFPHIPQSTPGHFLFFPHMRQYVIVMRGRFAT